MDLKPIERDPNKDGDLIQPFKFIDNGECPVCGGALMVYNFEADVLLLNSNGSPIKTFDHYDRCVGKCIKCGNEIPMASLGFIFVPVSEVFPVCGIGKKYRGLFDDIETIEDNPFIEKGDNNED